MAEVSTKPYLIRAIYEWCTDAGLTPHVAVSVDGSVRVPAEFVKNGEIVLNVSALATSRLVMDNSAISFHARFGGVARDVYVPIERVVAIYARENGQGMAFEPPQALAAAVQEPAAEVAVPRAVEGPSERPALVPVEGAAPGEPAPPPKGGERPRLTRVK
ncbi:MAG: ClpXP protease specificity-enhancing factor [Betaproteobacteria bacterium]